MEEGIYKAPQEQELAAFIGKVSAVKTRRGQDKDYFAFRTYIPKHVAEELKLANGDYVFFRAEKAKWYHMMEWKEMSKTWQRLPIQLKKEILLSGMEAPVESEWLRIATAPTMTYTNLQVTKSAWAAVSTAGSGAINLSSSTVPSGS